MTAVTRSNRPAAAALIAGFGAGLITMLTHPTGQDVIARATAGGSNAYNAGIHVLALLGQALLVGGTLGLTYRLRERRELAAAAFVAFAFASVAVLIAAGVSGLLAPMSVRGIGEADEAKRAVMLGALTYTGLINQAFAKLHVIFSCLAITLWSFSLLLGRELSRGLALFGLVLGAPLALAAATGVLPLDIHGFLLVVVTQGVWFTWAGAALWRERPA